jgi:hypothetical protein
MSKILDEKESDQMFAAEELGHKFIKLYLNKNRIAGIQKELHIHGVKRLNAYAKGVSDDGIQQFEFEPNSGIIKFKRNRQERAYVGFLWVDNEMGLYGKESYNIDFLATHVETGDFRIVDPKWKKIVDERYEHIKSILLEKKDNTEAQTVDKIDPSTMDIEDIDEHIKTLLAKKEALLKSKKGNESITGTENETKKPVRTVGRSATRRKPASEVVLTNPINTTMTEEEKILQGV